MTRTRPAPGGLSPAPPDWRADVTAAARAWITVLLVGVACGVVVVGVLSRLVMLLLASLNPDASGIRSDDGFIMGQFTLSGSLQLAASGAQIGAVGAFVYVMLRGLMLGPAWFRLLSISIGPGVVVGSILVHTTGVDFTILEPRWLTIGSFVLLPVLFCAALHLVAEKVLPGGGVRSHPLLVLGLLLAVAAFPLTLMLGIGWWASRLYPLGEGNATGVWPWVVRAALAVVFVLSVVDLVSDARALSA